MSASITSLKVIWKHPAVTQSDRKLASEQILRQLLTSLNASSTSRPQIDVGVSSLSLNSGSINLAFASKKIFADRTPVVTSDAGKLVSYTLPYLFQSIDTTTGPNANYALPVCETALVSALQYTDIGGKSGTHPNFPPFPLCRSKTGTQANDFKAISPNPAQASDGYQFPKSNNGWELAGWVSGPGLSSDWTANITVPTTLVKTVSSGSLYGDRTPQIERALNLLPRAYPLWDRTRVAAENTTGYSYIVPNASMLGLPDFSLYWSICNPVSCQWVVRNSSIPAVHSS